MTDVATALTQSLAYDGQTVPVANLPMGTYRHTGVGAGVALTDYARYDQVQNGAATYLSSVAGTNTITGSATPTPAAYAAGQRFILVPAATNTGATTVNVSSLGAKNLFSNGAACIGGEVKISVPVEIFYDGTQFNIIGPFLAGALAGLLKFKTGANIAAAATVDVSAATGNTLHLTGNTGVTGVTMTAGQVMDLIIDGTPLFTHHATNLNLPGAANIQGAAGDRMRLFYDGTTVYVLDYIRANGGIIRGLGVGQTFTDVSASRTSGVQYTNSTNYPIWVTISASSNLTSAIYLSVNGSSNTQVRIDGVAANVPTVFQAIVSPGDTYILTNSAGTLEIAKWWELR